MADRKQKCRTSVNNLRRKCKPTLRRYCEFELNAGEAPDSSLNTTSERKPTFGRVNQRSLRSARLGSEVAPRLGAARRLVLKPATYEEPMACIRARFLLPFQARIGRLRRISVSNLQFRRKVGCTLRRRLGRYLFHRALRRRLVRRQPQESACRTEAAFLKWSTAPLPRGASRAAPTPRCAPCSSARPAGTIPGKPRVHERFEFFGERGLFVALMLEVIPRG